MRGVGEEIEGFYRGDGVFFLKNGDVAGLSHGITREVEDFFWGDREEFF